MRLTANICTHKNCNNSTRAGFRFCYRPNCTKRKPKGDEEE